MSTPSGAVRDGESVEQDTVERLRNIAALFAGYASACKGGAVLYPGDFFDYPEQILAAADALADALSQLREARKDSARLDWMEARELGAEYITGTTAYPSFWAILESDYEGPTLRTALDSAMSASLSHPTESSDRMVEK